MPRIYAKDNVTTAKPDMITATDVGTKRALDVNIADGDVTVNVSDVLVACITEADLTTNVYTVTGDPATAIDGLRNNGPENITVTVANAGGDIVKVLQPGDVWDRDGLSFTAITFSAGAEFQADILR